MRTRAVVMGAAAMFAAALMSCRRVTADNAEDTSYRTRPGYVVDSVRPIAVDLARFRENLGPAPAELAGGGDGFDALVSRFARAVERRDSVSLQKMQVSAAEYAWLVYPFSSLTRPPYRQPPQIAWMLLRQAGDVGLKRLIARRGGSPLRIAGHACEGDPVVEGENRLWRRCTVTTIADSDTLKERLFGVVIERHGHFKFMSYQNQY